MKISDLLLMCVRNLTRHKFRTTLTIMGVVIGTCAIIVMISLGIGMGQSQQEMLESWGDLTVIEVFGYNPEAELNDEAIRQIQAIEGVDIATPFMRYYNAYNILLMDARRERYVADIQYGLVGVYPEALEKLGYGLLEGEYTHEASVRGKDTIAILFGEQAAYNFEDSKRSWPNSWVSPYPDEFGVIPDPFVDPLEDEILMRLEAMDSKGRDVEYQVQVTGILEGDYKFYETMGGAFIHIEDMKRIRADYEKANGLTATGSDSYDNVRVKATDINVVAEVEEAIHNLGFTDTYSMEGERQSMIENAQKTQMILGGLAAISLFVAAISIINTMLMSVYERTREIGVMKVLGCLVGNIRAIFLIEASLIGLIGGALGVGLSYLISYIMNRFGELLNDGPLGNLLGGGYYYGEGAQISIIPLSLVVTALVFSTSIGLISGFYPANRAVKISALEAIRTE